MKTATMQRWIGAAIACVVIGLGLYALSAPGCGLLDGSGRTDAAGNPFVKPEVVAAIKTQTEQTQAQIDAAKADAVAKAAKAKTDADAALAAQTKAMNDAIKAAMDAKAAAEMKDREAAAAAGAAATAAAAKAAQDKTIADANAAASAAAASAAEKTLALIAEVQKKVDAFTGVMQKAVNPDGSVNVPAGASAIGAVLPPPWNLITMIGIPLAVGLVQEMRKKKSDQNTADAQAQADELEKAARSIVNSIDVAKADPTHGPQMVKALDEMKDEMHGQLTDTAKKIIASEKVV